jgi:hypothetical protein
MGIVENLPWYEDYIFVIEGRRLAEQEIEDIENPEKQLQRIKKLYKSIGAEYSKNSWIIKVEEDLNAANDGENSRLAELKREVKFATVIENALQKQDDQSLAALCVYKDDERYKQLIKNVMFYIGVSKTKSDPEFIIKAYKGISDMYSLDKISLFVEEGAYYYLYYFQCLKTLNEKYRGKPSYNEVGAKIKERCYNARLMLNGFIDDIYVSEDIKLIMAEIAAVEEALAES